MELFKGGQRSGKTAQQLVKVQVRVYAKGPFKGRRYILNADGSQGRRLLPDATKAEIEAHLRGD